MSDTKDTFEKDVATDISVATDYLNKQCGELHLQWMIDRYWGQKVHRETLPQVNTIYDYLINNNHTADNPYDYGDYDASLFVISNENHKKVIVFKTNNGKFILIADNFRFDIRKIYSARSDDDFYSDKDLTESIQMAVDNAEYLLEFESDSARRHGLDFYQSINWEIPCKDYSKQVYGDGRDGGYVLSYQIEDDVSNQKIEHTIGVYSTLRYATDYISWICDDIKNKIEERVLEK